MGGDNSSSGVALVGKILIGIELGFESLFSFLVIGLP